MSFSEAEKKDDNGKWERSQSYIPCPVQTKEYCTTFHLINKGNSAEALYNMGKKSHTHNWTPKSVFRFYNTAMNNTYKIYKALVMGEEDANCICLNMGDAIKELAYALCQRGENIRTRVPSHPLHQRDMARVHGFEMGKKIAQMQNRHARL
jgi:hypothetical protein